LALKAKGMVYPNPMVGSVIVYQDKIIGEGFHEQYGGKHAEVNAIESVLNKNLLKEATLYVNLEPCCHWGKTPPCTDLIIRSDIKKVVIGSQDANPLMAGNGIKILKNAGVKVISGICEKACEAINLDFFQQFKQFEKSVKFTLKWAETADGFMGKASYRKNNDKHISNTTVKRFVHKLRSEHDGILIGTNTALLDNPSLNNRYWYGKSPAIILIDKSLKIPLTHQLFLSKEIVYVFNGLKNEVAGNLKFIKIDFETTEAIFWQCMNDCLMENHIHSVLIEGGSYTLNSILKSKLPLEIVRITSPVKWISGIGAPQLTAMAYHSYYLEDNLIEYFRL
jgi:diaminohydroxyphosphoribosylaminopyrimidine deaminase/5-amino-6-(5-phosphoribosylamino)uracil reductase